MQLQAAALIHNFKEISVLIVSIKRKDKLIKRSALQEETSEPRSGKTVLHNHTKKTRGGDFVLNNLYIFICLMRKKKRENKLQNIKLQKSPLLLPSDLSF